MRFTRDENGAVSLIAAGSLFAVFASAALAIDVGSLYLAKRRLQGAADAAALAAADSLTDPNGAASRALDANGIANATVTNVTPGTYQPDPAQPSNRRFVAGGAAPDADQVSVGQDVPLIFGRIITGGGTTRVAATATAARIDMAAFSIGSRLASLQGGLPGALLSALAGTQLSLSVMDYNALVASDVDLFAYTSALRTRLNLAGVDFTTVLATATTLPTAVQAIADATSDPGAAATLRGIASKLSATTITPAQVIDLGPYGARDSGASAPTIKVDSYALLRQTLALANGARQVALTPPVVSGLASLNMSFAIGQQMASSPWLTLAKDGSVTVSTAQARLYVDAGLPGATTLGLVSLRLPVLIQLAQAQAKLSAISCSGGPANATVTLAVQPSIGSASIADIDTSALASFSTPLATRRATIAHAVLADVTGASTVAFGGTTWQTVAFSAADIGGGVVKTVSTGDLVQGVAASLVASDDLRATALGLGVNLSALTAAVGAALVPAAPVLDGVLNQLTGLLGLGLGQADVRVDGVRCGKPTLVA